MESNSTNTLLTILIIVVLITSGFPAGMKVYDNYLFEKKAKEYLSGNAPKIVKDYCTGWANHKVVDHSSHTFDTEEEFDYEGLWNRTYNNCLVEQAYFDRRN